MEFEVYPNGTVTPELSPLIGRIRTHPKECALAGGAVCAMSALKPGR